MKLPSISNADQGLTEQIQDMKTWMARFGTSYAKWSIVELVTYPAQPDAPAGAVRLTCLNGDTKGTVLVIAEAEGTFSVADAFGGVRPGLDVNLLNAVLDYTFGWRRG